jgi:CheY-like chemotaxis protein
MTQTVSFLTTLKVLLAEDNEDDTILITRALKSLRWVEQLRQLSDGADVISYLRGEGEYGDRGRYPLPDVLLMDNQMPRLPGLDVLAWIRTEPRFTRLPVVLLTGGLEPWVFEAADRLQAAPVLKTPEFSAMPEAIKQGIARAQEIVQRNADCILTSGRSS